MCWTGSAFLEGMDWMMRKMPSRSAAWVLRRLPSDASISTGVQIVPHLEFSSGSHTRIRLTYCLTSTLSVSICTISDTTKKYFSCFVFQARRTFLPLKSCISKLLLFFRVVHGIVLLFK